MGWLDKFIVSERGQWDHPGKPTAVPTPDGRITMKGVPYPVIGFVPGYPPVRMEPGGNYTFPGNMVYEIPIKQSGGENEMPLGLPLRSSNPSSPWAYESPTANGYILPDVNRPELLNTGATEYKISFDDVTIPTVVDGNYLSPDDAYTRYMLFGEKFKPMVNPAAYSKFYGMVGPLGLMKQQSGGDISVPDLSSRGWLSKYQGKTGSSQVGDPYNLIPSTTTAVRDVTIQPKINIPTANFDFEPVDDQEFEKMVERSRLDEKINKRKYESPNITQSQAKAIIQTRLAEEEAQKKLNIKDYSNADPSEVTKLQQELYQSGYNIGKTGVDGDYNKNTDKAYKDYVSDQALDLSTIDRYYNKYKDPETDQYSKIVENIQRELVQEGLLKPEQVDGKFGNITKTAIQKYNKKGSDDGGLNFGKIPTSLKEKRCAAGMCEILETKGIDTKALGIKYTNAWDMVEKMNDLGNSQTIYNIYDDPRFRNVNSAQELKAVTRQVKKNSQTKAEDYKIGDIVGIFYSDSSHHSETLKSKTHNTHVGWVVDIDENGKPIIAHNMFGKIKKDPYDKVVTTWIQRPNREVLMISNAWQGKNNITYNDSDYKPTKNNDSIIAAFEQKIERPLSQNERKLINNNINRIQYSSEKIKNDTKSTAPLDWLQATAFGITGAESAGGIKATRSRAEIEEKEFLRTLGYDIKGVKDEDISLGVSKVKYSTLSPLTKQYFNITSPEDLGDDNKNIDVTIFNLATAYETFKDYASQYPELGLTETDIRNMAVLAHNQGIPSLLRTGRSKKEEKQGGYDYELEIGDLRSLYEGEIQDVSSTNWGRVFGDNPITRLFVDPSETYISKVNRYANEVFYPNNKKYGGWLDKYQGKEGSSQVDTTENFVPVSRKWYKDPQTGIMRNEYYDSQGYNPELGAYTYPSGYNPSTGELSPWVNLPAAEVSTELPAKHLARDMRNTAQGILEFSGELSGISPIGRTIDRLEEDPRQLGLDIRDTLGDAAYMFFNSPNERAKYNGSNPWTGRPLGSGLDATLDATAAGLTFAPALKYGISAGLGAGRTALQGTKQLGKFVRGKKIVDSPLSYGLADDINLTGTNIRQKTSYPKSFSELANTGFQNDPYYHQDLFNEKINEVLRHISSKEGRRRIQNLIDSNPHLQNLGKSVDDIINDFRNTHFEVKAPRFDYNAGDWIRDPDGSLSMFDVNPNNAYNWYRHGYQNPSMIAMGQNFTPYDARHIIEHEFAHLFQRDQELSGIDDILSYIDLKLDDDLLIPPSLSRLDKLKIKLNPFIKKTDQGVSTTPAIYGYGDPLRPKNYREKRLANQKAYWVLGDGRGQEKAAFAAEIRENLLQRGILKNRYDEITPKMLQKHFNLYHNTPGNKYNLRLYDIMKNNPMNFGILSQALNRLPATIPAVGLGYLGYEGLKGAEESQPGLQKYGGWLDNYK